MSNLIEECNLLRENKRDLVDALSAIGMDVDMSTPLSRLATYLNWASGYAGVGLATIERATGRQVIFTQDKWMAMSPNQQQPYSPIGICILAEGRGLIIAKEDLTYNNSKTMLWSAEAYDNPNLKNYAANIDSEGFYDDFDGAGKTSIICRHATRENVSYPAAQEARAYKAYTGDPTVWHLGDVAEWRFLVQFRDDVNEALNAFFDSSAKLPTSGENWYWTADEWGQGAGGNAWAITSSGALGHRPKVYTPYASRVRPFAPLSPTAIINP